MMTTFSIARSELHSPGSPQRFVKPCEEAPRNMDTARSDFEGLRLVWVSQGGPKWKPRGSPNWENDSQKHIKKEIETKIENTSGKYPKRYHLGSFFGSKSFLDPKSDDLRELSLA